MINKINQNTNIKAKIADKHALSENKSRQSLCNANDVLNHLHFTGATRFFRHNHCGDIKEVERIVFEQFKDKSNGILGSLPSVLIKELKESSKDRQDLTHKIKSVYEAFADFVKEIKVLDKKIKRISSRSITIDDISESRINEALEKAGIQKNKFKACEVFQKGNFSKVIKFKLGEEEFALKIFKENTDINYLNKFQSGNSIEQAKSLFLNKSGLKTASAFRVNQYASNHINYLKYVKMHWGDIKEGYLVTEFKNQGSHWNVAFCSPSKGELYLKPISELYSGLYCRDINIHNVINSTIIDSGCVYSKETMDKAQKKEYKELIKSIFKTTTIDEFVENILNNQDKFKKGFWDIDYVNHALTKAFEDCSDETKKLISEKACEELKSGMLEYARKNKYLTTEHFTYLVKNSSEKIKDEALYMTKHIPQKDLFTIFKTFFPEASKHQQHKLAYLILDMPNKDIIPAAKMLMAKACDDEVRKQVVINTITFSKSKDIPLDEMVDFIRESNKMLPFSSNPDLKERISRVFDNPDKIIKLAGI